MKKIIIMLLLIIFPGILTGKSFFKKIKCDVKKGPLIATINVTLKIPSKIGIYHSRDLPWIFSNLRNAKIHSKKTIKGSRIFKRFWVE